MLERLSDRWKAEASAALARVAVASAVAAAFAVALAFLCAAAFVVVLDRYGLIHACLAGAAFFSVVALVFLAVHAAIAQRQRRVAARMAARAAMETPSPLTDPRLLLVAAQIVQAIGFRRLLPLVALGGFAFAVAQRREKRGGRDSDARAPR